MSSAAFGLLPARSNGALPESPVSSPRNRSHSAQSLVELNQRSLACREQDNAYEQASREALAHSVSEVPLDRSSCCPPIESACRAGCPSGRTVTFSCRSRRGSGWPEAYCPLFGETDTPICRLPSGWTVRPRHGTYGVPRCCFTTQPLSRLRFRVPPLSRTATGLVRRCLGWLRPPL